VRRLAATLTTGLLLVAGPTACGDQGSAASAGEVVVGHASDQVTGDSAFVLLPTGRIDLTVGDPTEKLTDERVGAVRRAPDGGSFLPVSWSHDPFGESGVPIGVIGAEPQGAQVTLVAGGTRADLGSPYRVVGESGTADTGVSTMYVAVDQAPDDVGDVSFEVTYDGLTQIVSPATGDRDAGAAAPLYDEPTIGVEAPCTPEGFATPTVQPDVSCVVNAPQRTPYLPGQGWAEQDRTWLLVTVDITLSRVDIGRTTYDVQSVQPHLTVNGADPLPADERFGSAEPLPTSVRDTWAFVGAREGANRLTIALDLVLEKTSGPGPSTRRATVQQSVDLGAG
jgi:hypothetical protein